MGSLNTREPPVAVTIGSARREASMVPAGWRLLRSELRRCSHRNVIVWLPALAGGAGALVVVIAMVSGSTFSGRDLEGATTQLARVLIPLGATIGAAIEGSWFTSRTVQQLLLFEPRRHRVVLAQVLSIAMCISVVTAIGHVLIVGALAIWAAWSGQAPAGADLIASGRSVGVTALAVAAAAAIGGALAAITRSGAAAVAILLVGHLLIEQLLAQGIVALTGKFAYGMLPLGSLVESAAPFGGSQYGLDPLAVPAPVAACTWVAIVVAAAVICVRRRDIG